MHKIIKAVILAAALVCASAFADSFDQKALIAKAVDTTIANYKAGGLNKMREASGNCYRGLDLSFRNKNRERDAQYCIAQDNASIKLYNLLSKETRAAANDPLFASIDELFMNWISVADAVVRLTPEQYKFYLGPIMQGSYEAMGAKFQQ